MAITPETLVQREVFYCVSALVATLARTEVSSDANSRDMIDLNEHAYELASPVEDWEEAAREAGWTQHPAHNGAWSRDGAKGPHGETDMLGATSAQDACEQDDIEPYQREVFEHWIVSDWLADKLAEKGEKVDKDFAGLSVWARTTTGQAISLDAVIVDIANNL